MGGTTAVDLEGLVVEPNPNTRGRGAVVSEPFHDSLAVRKFPSVTQKKNDGELSAVVERFLAGLRLSGSEEVLGSLALALAESMDAAPPYARGKLARELREILAELAKAELSPANLSLLEGVDL
jgi:hypothetical protein